MATKAYLNLVKAVTTRTYVANGSGPVQYFQEMKRDQLSTAVVIAGMVDDEFIILCAQYDFMESGHDKENVCAIDVGWARANSAFEIVQSTVAHQETLFRWFQDYYSSRLKKLFDNGG